MASILGLLVGSPVEALLGPAKALLPYVIQGVTAGLSANEIQRQLSAAGLGRRRSTIQALVRGYRGAIAGAEYQRGLKGNIFPDPSKFRGTAGDTRKAFTYQVHIYGKTPDGRVLRKRFVNVISDTPLTNDAVEEQAAMIGLEANDTDPYEMARLELEAVIVNPALL